MSSSLLSCRRAVAPLSWLAQTRPVAIVATMPLKARITNPAFTTSSRQNLSDEIQTLSYPKDEPGDEADDVLFNSVYGVRTIELNRPKKLNSLNGSMARKIMRRLKEWEKSDMANVVIMAGAGPKAFCAGGDVAALALGIKNGGDAGVQSASDYFELEYRLDHTIASYGKPYIAYMDGITMGGGVGLSVHAPVRIATERTVFAMPETTIGFFPDVGATFFLPRMDGSIGTYLALTSDRLTGADVFHAGIATHYIESSSLAPLTQRLSELTFKDYASLDERLVELNKTIEEYTTGLPRDKPALLTGELRKAIDRCFSPSVVEDTLAALEREQKNNVNEGIRTWAEKTRATILERSPLSVRTTRRALEVGLGWDIRQTFSREATLAANFMKSPDFAEGVSARLIDKPARKPNWQPATLADVTAAKAEGMLKEGPAMQLVGSGGPDGYSEYPYAWLGLPSEVEVRRLLQQEEFEHFNQVVDHFVRQRNGKLGTAQKVKEILERCAREQNKTVIWTEPALGLNAQEKLEYSRQQAS